MEIEASNLNKFKNAEQLHFAVSGAITSNVVKNPKNLSKQIESGKELYNKVQEFLNKNITLANSLATTTFGDYEKEIIIQLANLDPEFRLNDPTLNKKIKFMKKRNTLNENDKKLANIMIYNGKFPENTEVDVRRMLRNVYSEAVNSGSVDDELDFIRKILITIPHEAGQKPPERLELPIPDPSQQLVTPQESILDPSPTPKRKADRNHNSPPPTPKRKADRNHNSPEPKFLRKG